MVETKTHKKATNIPAAESIDAFRDTSDPSAEERLRDRVLNKVAATAGPFIIGMLEGETPHKEDRGETGKEAPGRSRLKKMGARAILGAMDKLEGPWERRAYEKSSRRLSERKAAMRATRSEVARPFAVEGWDGHVEAADEEPSREVLAKYHSQLADFIGDNLHVEAEAAVGSTDPAFPEGAFDDAIESTRQKLRKRARAYEASLMGKASPFAAGPKAWDFGELDVQINGRKVGMARGLLGNFINDSHDRLVSNFFISTYDHSINWKSSEFMDQWRTRMERNGDYDGVRNSLYLNPELEDTMDVVNDLVRIIEKLRLNALIWVHDQSYKPDLREANWDGLKPMPKHITVWFSDRDAEKTRSVLQAYETRHGKPLNIR